MKSLLFGLCFMNILHLNYRNWLISYDFTAWLKQLKHILEVNFLADKLVELKTFWPWIHVKYLLLNADLHCRPVRYVCIESQTHAFHFSKLKIISMESFTLNELDFFSVRFCFEKSMCFEALMHDKTREEEKRVIILLVCDTRIDVHGAICCVLQCKHRRKKTLSLSTTLSQMLWKMVLRLCYRSCWTLASVRTCANTLQT